MRASLAPGLLILSASLLAAPASPRSEVTLDKREVSLGDRVVATYSAWVPAGSRIEVDAVVSPKVEREGDAPTGPVLDYALPGPETVGLPGPDGLVKWSRSVPFTPLLPGDLPIPGPHLVLVSATGEKTPFRPPQTMLKVLSRLPAGEKPEKLAPKADRPARIPPLSAWFWGAMALLSALLLAGLFLLFRRKAGAGSSPRALPPSVPPGPEFLAALDSLAGRLPSGGDDPRAFYSELTYATKRYLERQLKLPVLEWTTFETVRRLREAGWDLPREIGFSEVLGAADQVKFGRGAATRAEAERHLVRARKLYGHVEAALAAAASSAPPASGAAAAAKGRA